MGREGRGGGGVLKWFNNSLSLGSVVVGSGTSLPVCILFGRSSSIFFVVDLVRMKIATRMIII